LAICPTQTEAATKYSAHPIIVFIFIESFYPKTPSACFYGQLESPVAHPLKGEGSVTQAGSIKARKNLQDFQV
jgi:hypothetical protein